MSDDLQALETNLEMQRSLGNAIIEILSSAKNRVMRPQLEKELFNKNFTKGDDFDRTLTYILSSGVVSGKRGKQGGYCLNSRVEEFVKKAAE